MDFRLFLKFQTALSVWNVEFSLNFTLLEVNPELLLADDIDSHGQAFYTDLYTMIDTLPLPYRSDS